MLGIGTRCSGPTEARSPVLPIPLRGSSTGNLHPPTGLDLKKKRMP